MGAGLVVSDEVGGSEDAGGEADSLGVVDEVVVLEWGDVEPGVGGVVGGGVGTTISGRVVVPVGLLAVVVDLAEELVGSGSDHRPGMI